MNKTRNLNLRNCDLDNETEIGELDTLFYSEVEQNDILGHIFKFVEHREWE